MFSFIIIGCQTNLNRIVHNGNMLRSKMFFCQSDLDVEITQLVMTHLVMPYLVIAHLVITFALQPSFWSNRIVVLHYETGNHLQMCHRNLHKFAHIIILKVIFMIIFYDKMYLIQMLK